MECGFKHHSMSPLAPLVNATGSALAAAMGTPLVDEWSTAVHLDTVSYPDASGTTAAYTSAFTAPSEATAASHSPASHLSTPVTVH